MKKILLTFLLALSLFGEETTEKYFDSSEMDYTDLRIFVGIDGSYNYQIASESLDKSALGYSIYAGIPIYELELIAKKTTAFSNNLDLESTSFALNIPISGTGSRSVYVGFLGGNAKVTYNDSTKLSLNLIEKTTDGSFYGLHIGKRYKFSQNFFGRMELEYLKYNLQTKNTIDTTTLDLNSGVAFIYGLEYRF